MIPTNAHPALLICLATWTWGWGWGAWARSVHGSVFGPVWTFLLHLLPSCRAPSCQQLSALSTTYSYSYSSPRGAAGAPPRSRRTAAAASAISAWNAAGSTSVSALSQKRSLAASQTERPSSGFTHARYGPRPCTHADSQEAHADGSAAGGGRQGERGPHGTARAAGGNHNDGNVSSINSRRRQ